MSYSIIELSGNFRDFDKVPKSFLSTNRKSIFRFDQFIIKAQKILSDKSIKKIIINCKLDFQVGFLSASTEIYRILKKLKESGKEIIFYSRNYGIIELYLGSICHKMIMHPIGYLKIFGIYKEFNFFKDLINKYDIKMQVIKKGKYKSLGDSYILNTMSECDKEQYQAILDNFFDETQKIIKQNLNKNDDDFNFLINGNILNSKDAIEKKWINSSDSMEEIIRKVEKEKENIKTLHMCKNSYGKGKKIVILEFEGTIIDGKSEQNFLSGQCIGSETYIEEIKKIYDDDSIKGIILRINSPGGSPIASEEISKELIRLNEKKPVVISISEMAASGGYWVALGCDKIFAEKTSLVGSIGVISIVPYIGILKKFGISTNILKTGKYADMGSQFRELTNDEVNIIEKNIEEIYREFISKVSINRNITLDKVNEIAQGRVWSGKQAKENCLIDFIGGLDDAIEYLKNKLEINDSKIIFEPTHRYSFIENFIYGFISNIKIDSMINISSFLIDLLSKNSSNNIWAIDINLLLSKYF